MESQRSKKTSHKPHHGKDESGSASSSSDSDSDKFSGEDEDAEKTEASDLEELEKNPRALEAQFEAEVSSHTHHVSPFMLNVSLEHILVRELGRQQ